MKSATLVLAIALTIFSAPYSSNTWAAQTVAPFDQPGMSMNPSQAEREKMANSMETMADCLRSDEAFASCHDAFRSECEAMMGGSCMGMEHGKHKGMKHVK